ncbi:hypothetical protein [Pelagibacterium halotolerans]|uniref:hypothetical protein n=1 Tax=Pelagibacterium halotolerans TaxID=531813 RepID=UPI0005A25EE1|nr:hypothetical protein [Pelagibacterium halotolerans]MBP8308241.1 hypothetical protein [Burkholderiaceae bacterium]QJR17667.1 hypothetical protein HKM20_03970 [Pelagibacterium halotolerans]
MLKGMGARVALIAGLSALAGVLELVQLVVPGREGQWIDFHYSTAGAVLGGLGGALLAELARRVSRSLRR